VSAQSGLTRYIEEIRRVTMLETQKNNAAKRWREHGHSRRCTSSSKSHLRLVIRTPRAIGGYGVPISELIAEGKSA